MGVIVLQGEAQAYHIEDQLLQRIGAEEMENRRLICGNPYSFQGDERDVIFLSMVAAPNERIGAMTRPPDQRRFNVAASRARDQMWLFYSATTNDLSEQCFRRRLLEHFLNPMSHISQALGENAEELRERAYRANRAIEKSPAPFDSWFEIDVALKIAGQGYRVVPQYEFADKRIDLVVQDEKSQLAVECDGDFWHGADEYAADTERQRKLERCGWHFFRIRESRYYANPDKSLEPLWALLDRMGIKPLTIETEPEHEDDENGEPTVESQTTLFQVEKAKEPAVEPPLKQGMGVESSSSLVSGEVGSTSNSVAAKSLGLFTSEYHNWESHPLTDPRNDGLFHKVVDGLIEIIEAEGPMYCHRAYHLYAQACGIHKVGRLIRSTFNRAINRGATIGKLYVDQPNTPGDYLNCVVRVSNALETKLRPCGNRTLEEIPLSEIAALMDLIADQLFIHEEEILFREVLDRYEIKRLTSKASSILESAKKLMD